MAYLKGKKKMKRLKNGLVFEGVKLVVVKSERQVTLVNKFNGYAEIVETELATKTPTVLFKTAKLIGCGVPTLEHLQATLNGIHFLDNLDNQMIRGLMEEYEENDFEEEEEEDE